MQGEMFSLPKSQLGKKSTWQKVNLAKSQLGKKSTWQKVNLPKTSTIAVLLFYGWVGSNSS
jgi:hypothetical protein